MSQPEIELFTARVVVEHRGAYVVRTPEGGDSTVSLLGKLRHDARTRVDLPAVGDWVRVRGNVIEEVLPRNSVIIRKGAGTNTEPQVIASNIDTVFVVAGLDLDFNVRRIERFYAAVLASGARCVIVLNKADLGEDLAARLIEVQAIASDASVLTLSALHGEGVGELAPFLTAGETVAFVGSSGAGKSTLINRLMGGDHQTTGPVRGGDSRGRHTTTHRELFETPSGVFLIDTPGLRELQPWAEEAQVEEAFPDIDKLAVRCRYRDCTHGEEKGCAVRRAIEQGRLDAERLAAYVKLRKEAAGLDRQVDVRAQIEQKAKLKKIHKAMRNIEKADDDVD